MVLPDEPHGQQHAPAGAAGIGQTLGDYLVEPLARLAREFRGRCQVAFGVGTHLTNDLGPTPLNIVIKMVRCNGQPVAKLSDSPGKSMCDDLGYLAYLRQVFGLPAAR